MSNFTIGTHNLHDEAKNASPFADIILFTEAPKTRAGRREMLRQMPGYGLKFSFRQRSLVIAYRKAGPFKPRRVKAGRFYRAHGGQKGVTPMRGTFCVLGKLNGEPAAPMVEHRINRSYAAGPGSFRRRMWKKHRRVTARAVERRQKKGDIVFVGGDPNCSSRTGERFARLAYAGTGLHERGRNLDRLGIDPELRVSSTVYLSNNGSDHPRLRATASQR